jgi:hypothetical protein
MLYGWATRRFERDEHSFDPTHRTGWEAGLQGSLQLGHFALQPAILYSQHGFGLEESYGAASLTGVPTVINERYRLNYLTVPLNLAYTSQANGQGWQVFGGAYVGLLLGGSYSVDNKYAMFPAGYSPEQRSGRVVAQDAHTTTYGPNFVNSTNFYSRHLDAGLQAGIGYRIGGALLQLSYSLGLRNLGTTQIYDYGTSRYTSEGLAYRNRALQASLTYLVGSKS